MKLEKPPIIERPFYFQTKTCSDSSPQSFVSVAYLFSLLVMYIIEMMNWLRSTG